MSIMRRALAPLLALATSIALAYTLFGLGFVACTTRRLPLPLAAPSLVGRIRCSRRRHGGNRRGNARFLHRRASIDELSDAIRSALEDSNPQLVEAFAASGLDIAANQGKAASVAGALSDRYTCRKTRFPTCKTARPSSPRAAFRWELWGVCPCGTYSALGFLAGRKAAGRAMQLGAALVATTLLALTAWAITDFDGLFTWMHQMLFSQGNWTFSKLAFDSAVP